MNFKTKLLNNLSELQPCGVYFIYSNSENIKANFQWLFTDHNNNYEFSYYFNSHDLPLVIYEIIPDYKVIATGLNQLQKLKYLNDFFYKCCDIDHSYNNFQPLAVPFTETPYFKKNKNRTSDKNLKRNEIKHYKDLEQSNKQDLEYLTRQINLFQTQQINLFGLHTIPYNSFFTFFNLFFYGK